MSAFTNHPTWYNIAVMGDVGVGKTAIIRRIDEGYFMHTHGTTTLGKEFIQKRFSTLSGVMVTCRIWDTSDLERHSTNLPSHLYRPRQGFVFVFSLTSKHSLRNLKLWIDNAKSYYSNGLPPAIILANKSDDTTHCENNFNDACEIYKGIKCFETSALEDRGIDEAFSYLATEILLKSRIEDDPDEPGLPIPNPIPDPPFNFISIMKTCSIL